MRTTDAPISLIERLDERVDAIGSEADARTDELYEQRRLPADLYRSITEAGLLRQLIPVGLGGLGRTPLEWFRTGMALARHEASLGWVVTQGAAELAWISAGAREEWAREVLADPHAASASSVAGIGTIVVDGERSTFAGTWAFNTGCHGATWIGGMALVDDGGDATNGPRLRFGWVPAERAEIVESWDPNGLHGTGSHTTVIREQHIPTSWTFDPFSPTANDRGPFRCLVGNGNWPIAASVAATQLGNARRALDAATEHVSASAPMPDLSPLIRNAAVQRSLADLEGRWLGAVAAVERELVAMWEEAIAFEELSVVQRVQLHRANIAASRVAVDVVDRLCDITGTQSVDRRRILGRCQRDAHALRGHVAVAGSAMEHNTKVAAGLEPSHHLV